MAKSQPLNGPMHSPGTPLWGVSAEFDSAEGMLAALHLLRGRGLGRLGAYSPVPVVGAAEAVGFNAQPLRPVAIGAACSGAVAMFAMCSYATTVSYRFDIGGRPLFSWPAFVVPSISFGALCGALAVTLGLLALSRLPRLNHPAFNIPDFTRATEDRFFIAVEARDEGFDAVLVEDALALLAMRPTRVHRVPR